MKFGKLSLVVLLLFGGIVGAAVIDNADQLYVPSGETYTLSGTHSYSSSVVIEGTVYITGYTGAAGTGTLELVAPGITVSGTINGNERGYRTGEGPGPGSYPGGGGAYGGNGGASGWGNLGGTAYGTASGSDIQMGSGGASQTGGVGGPGGASVSLFANTLTISGLITVNGSQGTDYSDWGDGGGGGAGGGILVKTISVTISGTLSANGLRGGNSVQRRGGGGGGGGRIKIFYGTVNKAGMSYSTSGGAGGSGPTGNGSAGASGTYYEGQVVFDDAKNLYVPAGFVYEMIGTHQYSNSAVIAGQVNVAAYDGTTGSGTLELSAPDITVSGTINGNERGYRTGEGPGPGSYPGGGGAYGGNGGASGWGNLGGTAYGTADGSDIQMGSGGASQTLGVGGPGGASVSLLADTLTISGLITVNGSQGTDISGWGDGGGGGAGGGILFNAISAKISGTLSANGLRGGNSVQRKGGGGAAGGRIKIFSNVLDIATGTFLYTGGAGGNGTTGNGSAGGTGTFFTGRPLIADLNHDGTVNFLDIAILSMHWLDSL